MCVLFNSSLDYLLGSHPSPSLVVIINNDFFEIVFRVILGLLWEYLGIKLFKLALQTAYIQMQLSIYYC